MKVTNQTVKLQEFIASHKNQLDLLDLNQKAEPFKELIQNNLNEWPNIKKRV